MKDRYLKPAIGCLLGGAVGDALGLPYKKLSRKKIHLFHTPIKGHTLIVNKGMFSNDTEHSCMTAQSLIVSGGDPAKFSLDLAWRLRLWLIGCPARISPATLKSCLRLWIGLPPQKSGVNSGNNDPAVRSAIIGVCYGEDPAQLLALVKASTVMTHNSYKAELGAIAVAVAAYLASIKSLVKPIEYYQILKEFLTHPSAKLSGAEAIAFLCLIEQACLSGERNETAATFADKLDNNRGISSDIYHTVPMVIQVWLRNQHRYSQGIREIIYLGGDTNTTAAILGGIVGASVGISGIPFQWVNDIIDFPRSVKWIESLGIRLAFSCKAKSPYPALPLAFYCIPLRNLVLLIAILYHAFYGLLPF